MRETIENKNEFQLTERDGEILQFINEFGFCTLPQLEKRFSFRGRRSYQIMSRLIKAGLVRHQRIFHNEHGVFYLTILGSTYTELPALERISVALYNHQMQLTNTYLALRNKYPDSTWISERQLQQEKCAEGIGKRGHIADGILILKSGEQIAIEVELTMKGKHRIENILKSYSLQHHISEVWYFSSDEIHHPLSALVTTKSFVKIFRLKELLRE